jgi:hypothetical protein
MLPNNSEFLGENQIKEMYMHMKERLAGLYNQKKGKRKCQPGEHILHRQLWIFKDGMHSLIRQRSPSDTVFLFLGILKL